MNDASPQAPDPLRAWLEVTGDEAGHGGDRTSAGRQSSRRLFATTAVVTAAAGVLAVGALAGSRATSTAPSAAVSPSPVIAQTPAPATPNPALEVDPAAPAAVVDATAAAAVLAVRSAAAGDTYIDTAVAQSVDTRHGVPVVTVLAWVLQRRGGVWDRGSMVRYGVALDGSDAASGALAPPWILPAPASAAPRRSWRPVDDQAIAEGAAATLRTTGYRDLEAVELRRDPALPLILSALVTATAPGRTEARQHEVWLTPDASAVLGAAPAATPPVPGVAP
jgi:hypothetical protein